MKRKKKKSKLKCTCPGGPYKSLENLGLWAGSAHNSECQIFKKWYVGHRKLMQHYMKGRWIDLDESLITLRRDHK